MAEETKLRAHSVTAWEALKFDSEACLVKKSWTKTSLMNKNSINACFIYSKTRWTLTEFVFNCDCLYFMHIGMSQPKMNKHGKHDVRNF